MIYPALAIIEAKEQLSERQKSIDEAGAVETT
jgi:hypothetical protein